MRLISLVHVNLPHCFFFTRIFFLYWFIIIVHLKTRIKSSLCCDPTSLSGIFINKLFNKRRGRKIKYINIKVEWYKIGGRIKSEG